eukprot:SAG31_NODE_4372_length_3301_cov_3.460962_2_plen_74_part_00
MVALLPRTGLEVRVADDSALGATHEGGGLQLHRARGGRRIGWALDCIGWAVGFVDFAKLFHNVIEDWHCGTVC